MGIFKLIESHGKKGEEERGVTIGLDVRIADKETLCPVSRLCQSLEDLAREAELIQDDLERILTKAKRFLGGASRDIGLQLGPDMPAEEIWSVLSRIEDEDLLVEQFNGLDDTTRGAVAEHVLTRCNVFSGMAAVFSARYDNESGYMA
jgi:hypothetical protein